MIIPSFIRDRHSAIASALRYLLVGVFVYLADFGVFYLLYKVWGADPQIANLGGKSVGTVVGFVTHKYITYLDRRAGGAVGQAAKYITLVLSNVALSSFLLFLLIDILELPVVISRIFVDIIILLASFFGMRHFVFRR